MRWTFCAAVLAFGAWQTRLFYVPGQGFTSMITFGTKVHERYLPELKAVNHYEMPDSYGYDAQWYAQMAMRPRMADPALNSAVDWLHYRARRILFPAVAWLLGGGNPARALHVYAFENVVCWFALALLLFRWLPPDSWGNCGRWAAVLFSFGLVFSVERALLEGPSLLLLAIAMALIESKRPWLGSLVLGISGLGKETNILGGVGLPLDWPTRGREWAAWILRWIVVAAPLLIWVAYLRRHLGPGDDIGDRNFAAPFAGLAHKLGASFRRLSAPGYDSTIAWYDLLTVAGLLTQFAFFAVRPRWRDPWWRIGATYALLMVFLGDAVWENYPTAAARVLLPMTLAFNLIVPRGRGWTLLLLAGNIGILSSAEIHRPPDRDSYVVEGPRYLHIDSANGAVVDAAFGPVNWGPAERTIWQYWRWSEGDCTVTIRNPRDFTIESQIRLKFRTPTQRRATVTQAGRVLWSQMLPAGDMIDADLGEVDLLPGDTVLTFTSDRPATLWGAHDPRKLSFSVRDLDIRLVRSK
jgi:hypothetical protein